ncbi:MAG: NDP-sugar synthase [Armatimonadetes bacterium]|nr:NDP-sugar synthase [Armatimonadota bacterium]
MKAMILAAGEGTRLRPLTLDVPKPMIPIVGVPLLARTLSWLAGEGVTEAAINLFHRPQSIPDFFGDEWRGIRLHYLFEDSLRGTAGGVKGAAALLRDAPFYVVYGDNLIHADLRRLADFHARRGGIATVALFHHPNPPAAGIVAADPDGRVTRFVEKPPPDLVFSDTANAGVYVLDPAVLDDIPADRPSDFGKDIFPDLLARGRPLYGDLLGGYLQDTGTTDAYRQANWDVLLGKTGDPADNSPVWADPTARVSPSAQLLGRNVIGPNVVIEGGARLTDCILWDGAYVGPEAVLHQAILARHAVVAGRCAPPEGIILGQSEKYGYNTRLAEPVLPPQGLERP